MADGLFSKIFYGVENGADPLKEVFSWFDDWEKGLCTRAVEYVHFGDGRPVLAALPAARPVPEKKMDYAKRQEPFLVFAGFFGAKPEELARYVEVLSAAFSITPQRTKYSTWIASETPDNVVILIELMRESSVRTSAYEKSIPDAPDMVSFYDVLKSIELLGGTPADMISGIVPSIGHGRQRDFKLKGKLASEHLHTLPASDFIESLKRRKAKERAEVIMSLHDYPVAKDPAFLDCLIKSASAGSAQVRDAAQKLLAQQPDNEVTAKAIPMLDAGAARVRASAVQILGRIGSDAALDAMKKRVKLETSQDILTAINNFVAINAVQVSDAPGEFYVAADSSVIEIPDFQPLFETDDTPFGPEDLARLNAMDKEEYERRLRRYHRDVDAFKAGEKWIQHKPIRPEEVSGADRLLAILNAPIDTKMGEKDGARRSYSIVHLDHLWPLVNEFTSRLPDLRLVHLSLIETGNASAALNSTSNAFVREMSKRILAGTIDIRQILHAAQKAGIPAGYGYGCNNTYTADEVGFLTLILDGGYLGRSCARLTQIWPITASHLGQVLEALPPQTLKLATNLYALQLLQQLPKLPMAAINAVLYAALDKRRLVNEPAQAMLLDVEGIDERIIVALTDKHQTVRGRAARYIADRGVREAVPAITKRLRTEKSEGARAEMISAISRLGGDTSPYLGRAALAKEAQALVKKLPNAKINWLHLETAPDLRWADGEDVDHVVPDAWLRLALKLKSPAESSLFCLYLEQLDDRSAMEFGDWVLTNWIAYDTFKQGTSELRKQAQKQAESCKAAGQGGWARMSIDEIASYLLQKLSARYPNSGTDATGILALTHLATPTLAATSIAAYLKNHGRRVSQAKCLVEVLAAMGTREALQVLVAIATRFKQRTVRQLAETCVATIAEERGWSEDELADRSIPTAGIEEDGVIALEVGEQAKAYTARLDSDLNVELFNPDGKEVKAIPAGKDENTKEARKLLSDAKKTVKTVVAQQSARLYDAMVGARRWTSIDWEADIVGHPIMVRLIERIIWRALAEDGSVVAVFRPTPEGDRLTASGDDADLSAARTIDIAHTTMIDEDMRQAWLTHMEDFEVTPLFAQLTRPMRALDEKQARLISIKDCKGWLTEAFKLRSATARFGFERGPIEDGGNFTVYVKTFRNAGVRVELNFTGSYVPEENIPVAITGLRFFKAKQEPDAWPPIALELASVPAIVLFEAWNDLHEIASVGVFDEHWQKKGLF